MKILKLYEYLNEKVDVKHVDKLSTDATKLFKLGKAEYDGSETDDIIKTTKVSIPAKNLKPSQKEIFLAKSIAMAVAGIVGGNLESIASSDDFIMDGHHRWAATMFNNPNAELITWKSDLDKDTLLSLLRKIGDAFGNSRRGNPNGKDVNIFDATMDDVYDAINGKGMRQSYKPKDGLTWLNTIGAENIENRLNLIQKFKKSVMRAPKRIDMPVIDPELSQVKKTVNLLNKGDIDVAKPYAKIK